MTEIKIPGGYIILSRKIIESEIWEKPPLYLKVWIWLIAKAQHKDFKQLKRGQLYTNIKEIMEGVSWYIGFRKETPTKDQIFQVLEWMRKESGKISRKGYVKVMKAATEATMITTMKATQGILINIINYGLYQESKNYESNEESNNETDTGATREQRQPDNINKNDKNVKNDKNDNKNLIQQIENLRQRYSEFFDLLDAYLDILNTTRRGGKVSDGIILKIYQEMDKYPVSIVKYACLTIINNPAHHSKRENYFYGILRNTTADDAVNGIRKMEKSNNQKKDDWRDF